VRELTVEGLPAVIPERIEIDVSDMEIGDTKTLADLVPPPGITILGEPDDVVVLVSATRGAREEEGVEGEEEGEAGPGEGEERPAGEGDEEA
jgi:large subunit ribosomal protein L25